MNGNGTVPAQTLFMLEPSARCILAYAALVSFAKRLLTYVQIYGNSDLFYVRDTHTIFFNAPIKLVWRTKQVHFTINSHRDMYILQK